MGLFGRSKRKSRETLGFRKPISATDQYYLNQAQQKASDNFNIGHTQPSRAYSLSGQAASTALYAHNQRQNSLTSYRPPSIIPAYERRTMSLNSGSLRNSQTPRMRMNSITSTTTSVLVKTTKETLQDGSTRSITRQTIQDLGDYEIVQTTRIIPKHVVTASDNDLEALIGDFDQDFHNEIDYIPEEDEAVEENQGNSNDTSSGYYSVYSDAEEAPTRVVPRSNVPSPRQPIEHSDSITSSNLRKNVKFHAPPQQPKKEMKPKKRVQLTDEEMYSKAMEVAMAKVYGDRLDSMNKRGDATNPAVTVTPSLTEQSIDGKHASKELIKIEADAQASRVHEKKGEPASNGKSDGKFDNSHSDASTGPTTPPASTTPSPASTRRKFFKMGSNSETKRHSSSKSKHPSPQKSQLMRRVLALFDLA